MLALRSKAAVVVSALIAGLIVGGSLPAANAAGGTLSGTVTEAGSGAQLAGVSVQAFCWQVVGFTQGQVCGETQTASDGTYSVPLTAGTYKVLFDHYPAQAAQFYGGGTDLSSANSLQVVVPSNGSVTGIDAALVPLRSVTGTVTGNAGPLGGINVTAYRQSGGPSWQSVQGAVTAPDGSYVLHLPDGTYRVGFADAYGPYRTVFYNAAGTVDQANDVVVAGYDVAGINADMPLNHAITGSVTVDDVNMPGVTVTAWQQVPDGSGSTFWDAVKVTATGDAGTYALYLPDGTYRIEFKTYQARFPAQFYPGADSIDEGADVVLAGADVPNIGATVISDPQSGPAISGTVTVASTGDPADGIHVIAYRWNVLASAWRPVRDGFTAPDGTYALYVPEGPYRVGFSYYSGLYRAAFYSGADTIDAADDIVVPTAGVANIDEQLAENHAITGVISADPMPGFPPGAPPAEVTAWRWNAATADWDRVQDAFNALDGTYVLYVPPGTYRIGFAAFGPFLPVFYDGVDNLGDATDVTMADADVPNINAHLVPESTVPPPPWPTAATLSAAGQNAWAPQVAVGGNGAATAVWYRRDGSHSRVQATSRAGNGPWSSPVNLSKPGEDASDPQVALGPKGTAVAVWRVWDGAHYQVQETSRAADGTWSAPVTLSKPGGDSWDPQVAASAKGTAVAVWRQADGTRSLVQAVTQAANGRWSAPVALSKDGGDAWDPQVAVGSDGTADVVWSRSDGAHYRVQVTSHAANGSWSSPVAVSQAGEDAWDPQVAVGAKGTAAAVWRRSDGINDRVQASSAQPGGAWSTAVAISPAGRNGYDPQVTVHPDGMVTAVWDRWDGSNDRVQAASQAPGGPWSTPKTLSRAGESAEDPQVAGGPDGKASAVWRQSDVFNGRVLAAIRMPDGSWSGPTELAQSEGPNYVPTTYGPAIAAGSDGAVGAVWERRDDADDRVQGVVRIDPPGNHCRNQFGVDLNVLFGVPEQFVDGPCSTITTASAWRPLAFWYTNTAFDAVPPGFVPAAATPLEDLLTKLTAVEVVVDGGTKRQRTVVLAPTAALRIDHTFEEYAPGGGAYPMAVAIPRMTPLLAGDHTVQIIWTLSAEHCDGFTDVEAYSCLPSGDVSFGTRHFVVASS
jgi:5-hydroxyisourate hydrolase-like protein (transthyretin family)